MYDRTLTGGERRKGTDQLTLEKSGRPKAKGRRNCLSALYIVHEAVSHGAMG